ncbi:NAD(P)-dependent alcohol dehydrogenase [Thetidibacter halocola]|uniref:NAD(P)-dependent alcohol dehydrogenase n=1 Tax=Thetidibacter halocola TaxID=2827239 RepID=A0A8J7WFB1_9RHOB|nr:NAD(P)-dependent alcohol dehydrogenase [Thetidibacter halocola]MBS0125757.1 NAD(P)-dependent alcohol dehydrogenase [Thetidibacter halocola]
MKAAIYTEYGAADTVRIAEIPTPAPGPKQVLIRVRASSVTTADWRLRASAFPGILWLPGRLMTGLLRPRNSVLGMEMAGEVVAVGHAVTRFTPGQRVFGFAGGGAHAEFLVLDEDATILPTPDDLSDAEAAALPFGALCALVFLRDVANVAPGQRVLILGGSGGVGVYAIQVAKALGANVTASASAGNSGLMRDLGADVVLDYRVDDPASAGPYDLVFDTVGATNWARIRTVLRKTGLFLPLNFGARELWHMLRAKLAGGPRIVLHVNADRADDLRVILGMIADGLLRPVIDRRFPLERIAQAHVYVEGRHRKGAVIVDVTPAAQVPAAA